MKSYMLGKYLTDPATRRTVNRLLSTNNKTVLKGVTFLTIVDNSTGTAANGWKEVKKQGTKFTHVNAETDLALSSDFYVVAAKANNGIAVLKGILNASLAALEMTQVTGGNGTVATPGTIPAQEKVVDGTAAATALAISRNEGNTVIGNLRDNMSTLLLAYNRLQEATARARQMDYGEAKANSALVLANMPAAGDPITNAGDAMSKVAADAAFAQIADNTAKLAALLTSYQTAVD